MSISLSTKAYFGLTDYTTGVSLDPLGEGAAGEGPAIEKIFSDFLGWCESFKIPIVVAAGNDPVRWLHEQVPQKFGKPDNVIVTVGGVKHDGMLYPNTTPAKPGKDGSMSVYAPAVDVIVPADGIDFHTGTSQAAAIVVSET